MPDLTKYAVRCLEHGLVPLSDEEYNAQMGAPDSLWECPLCRRPATWDDETYEAYVDWQEQEQPPWDE